MYCVTQVPSNQRLAVKSELLRKSIHCVTEINRGGSEIRKNVHYLMCELIFLNHILNHTTW